MKEANDAHAKFINLEGDHLSMMNTFYEYKRQHMDVDWCFKNYLNHRHLKSADDVRDQLKIILEKMGIFVKDDIPINFHTLSIKKCILTGYFTQVSILQKNNVYLTSNFVSLSLVKDSQVVTIHPSSVLNYRPEFVLYNDLVLTKKNYMRTVMSIKPEWLFEIAPIYFRPESIKNVETRKALQKVEKGIL